MEEVDGEEGEGQDGEGGDEKEKAAAAGFGGGASGVGFGHFDAEGRRSRSGRLAADRDGDDGGGDRLRSDAVFASDFAFQPGEVFADEVALTLELGEPLRIHGCERRGEGEIRKKKKRRGKAALEE